MNQKHKPSLLFWGNSLINLSIFSEKIEICKTVEDLLKIKINKSKLFIFSNYFDGDCHVQFILICHRYSINQP